MLFHLFWEFSLAGFVCVWFVLCLFVFVLLAFLSFCLLFFGLDGENSCIQLAFHFFCKFLVVDRPCPVLARQCRKKKECARLHRALWVGHVDIFFYRRFYRRFQQLKNHEKFGVLISARGLAIAEGSLLAKDWRNSSQCAHLNVH